MFHNLCMSCNSSEKMNVEPTQSHIRRQLQGGEGRDGVWEEKRQERWGRERHWHFLSASCHRYLEPLGGTWAWCPRAKSLFGGSWLWRASRVSDGQNDPKRKTSQGSEVTMNLKPSRVDEWVPDLPRKWGIQNLLRRKLMKTQDSVMTWLLCPKDVFRQHSAETWQTVEPQRNP